MIPPHLPPPSSSIVTHHSWTRLKIILFVTLMGLFAGLAGSFMVLGWVWPNFVEEHSGGVSYTRSTLNQSALSDRLRQELNERIMTVYQASSAIGTLTYLPQKSRRSEAVVISSDGWIIFYDPTIDQNFKNWQVVGFDGAVFSVSESIVDQPSGLNYARLKINNKPSNQQEFKVANFASELKPLTELFVHESSGWRHSVVEWPLTQVVPDTYLDAAPHDFYSLSSRYPTGALAVNMQGEIAGIVRAGQVISSATALIRSLPSVLSEQRIRYPSLGTEGFFSSDQPIIHKKVEQVGFLITKILVPGPLRRGDLLTEINGQVVTPANLWHTIGNRPATVRVKVLRNNKIVELVVPVVEL